MLQVVRILLAADSRKLSEEDVGASCTCLICTFDATDVLRMLCCSSALRVALR